MKPRHVVGFLAAIGLTFGQTLVDLKTQTKNVDFSRALSVRPFPTGTGLPSVCSPGQMFFKSDAASGANLYGCVTPNSWVLESLGPTGGAAIIALTSGSGDPPASCTAPSTTNLAKYYDSTAKKMWTCVDANTWQEDITVDPAAAFLITGNAGATPAAPATGKTSIYSDSTQKGLSAIDDTGQITRTVKPTDCSGTGFLSKINPDGTVTCGAGGSGGSGLAFSDHQMKTSEIILVNNVYTPVYSTTIPANTLPAGRCLDVRVNFKHSSGSANIIWKIWLGAQSFQVRSAPQNESVQMPFQVCNNPGGVNAQQLEFPIITWSDTSGGILPGSSAINEVVALTVDTTVDQVLKITALQDIGAGDGVTGLSWLVALR